MNPIANSVATIAISAIYALWQSYRTAQIRRQALIRERVAYMLWEMAKHAR